MLASDLNNPEFTNPMNPDTLLHVEFYWHEPVDKWASEAAGKEVRGARQPFVRIVRPGDNTSIHETAVRDDHKRRWPQLWLAWQMKEGLIEGEGNIPGWKIEDWDVIKHDQLHELKYLRFHTVEQIAGASDAQVQRLGMAGVGLRAQAQAALKEKAREGVKAELEAKDAELKAMAERLERLESRMAPSVNVPYSQALPLPEQPPTTTTSTTDTPKRSLSPEHIEKMQAGRAKKAAKRAAREARRAEKAARAQQKDG